jgi:hypothetical protein
MLRVLNSADVVVQIVNQSQGEKKELPVEQNARNTKNIEGGIPENKVENPINSIEQKKSSQIAGLSNLRLILVSLLQSLISLKLERMSIGYEEKDGRILSIQEIMPINIQSNKENTSIVSFLYC